MRYNPQKAKSASLVDLILIHRINAQKDQAASKAKVVLGEGTIIKIS